MYETAPDPIVHDLAEALTERLDTLVAGMAERIVKEIDFYHDAGVRPEDLHDSLRHNTRFILAHLAGTGGPLDLSGPTETGRRRAVQGVPLPEVLRAYRLGFAHFWDQLLVEAREMSAGAPRWSRRWSTGRRPAATRCGRSRRCSASRTRAPLSW